MDLARDSRNTVIMLHKRATPCAISNKQFSPCLLGGVGLNFNQVFISGGYMQAPQSYTTSSGPGSGKVSWPHTMQFGIGYPLFNLKKLNLNFVNGKNLRPGIHFIFLAENRYRKRTL
jgi:hypothetical protein